MIGLTERQRKILDYIRSYLETHKYPPTLREIGEYAGIASTNGVADHIRALKRKGFVTYQPQISRSLRLIEGDNPETTSVESFRRRNAIEALSKTVVNMRQELADIEMLITELRGPTWPSES